MKSSTQASSEVLYRTIGVHEASGSPRALMLDVRTSGEFQSAHIPGSVSYPLSSIDSDQVADMVREKGVCLLTCRSGARAKMAAEKLARAGVPHLEVLEGGLGAWEKAGLDVVRGKGVISLERQVRIAAGLMVLSGVLLGIWVHPAWLGLSGFVGCGLVFAGITDWCGMGLLLARLPWNNR